MTCLAGVHQLGCLAWVLTNITQQRGIGSEAAEKNMCRCGQSVFVDLFRNSELTHQTRPSHSICLMQCNYLTTQGTYEGHIRIGGTG